MSQTLTAPSAGSTATATGSTPEKYPFFPDNVEFPGSEVASCAEIAAWIPLEFHWQPRRAGIGADHHKQGIGFASENLIRLLRRLQSNLNPFQMIFTGCRDDLRKGKNLDICLRCNLVCTA